MLTFKPALEPAGPDAMETMPRPPMPSPAIQVDSPENRIGNAVNHHARIMMVDDEPSTILAVQKYLRLAGYQNVAFTTDPSHALEMIRNQRPDLVLVDIVMPGLDGLELLRQIRREYRLQHLPVIILTANGDPLRKREALERGANDFLAKPLDVCELTSRVRNVLAFKAHWDQMEQYVRQLEHDVRERTEQLVAVQRKAEQRGPSHREVPLPDPAHAVAHDLEAAQRIVARLHAAMRPADLSSLSGTLGRSRAPASHHSQAPEGGLVPEHLLELIERFREERREVLREINQLAAHLDNMRAVVTKEQRLLQSVSRETE